MAYCEKCGHQVSSGASFCANCGAPVTAFVREDRGGQEVRDGKLYICPRCGEGMNAFDAVCSTCGYERRGSKVSSAVREFQLKLEAIEAQRERKKSGKNLSQILDRAVLSATDEQKISLISSFIIPNTREDLYEFLILAESNINPSLYSGEVPVTSARIAVSDAWRAKFDQAYNKAKLLYSKDDSRFRDIQEMYENKQREIKKAKWKIWKLMGVLCGVTIALLLLILLITTILDARNEKEELVRLEGVVAEIETAMDAGEYKFALMLAESLDFSVDLSSDAQKEKWDIQREYWFDKIISVAAADGIILERPSEEIEETIETIAPSPTSDVDIFSGFIEGFSTGLEGAQEAFDEFKEIMNDE